MERMEHVKKFDPEIYQLIMQEKARQQRNIELIASENYASEAVLEALGNYFNNKYAEGYPGKRYYGGCEYTDLMEDVARDRLKQLFQAEHANVQPHSGAQANTAVYLALLQPGDTVMGMNLNHGGHLTHGSKVNLSGKIYNFIPYGVDKETERIDYDEMEKIALDCQPKLIVAGASAYSREIDFKRISEIAKKVNAYLMVDMAHIAGLVAAGLHISPVPYADVVTSTTHKTLRGPRGGIILCKKELAAVIDKAVFPGMQGGPLEHVIAAKAVAFKEALSDDFKVYQQQTVQNAKALANGLNKRGLRLVSGGTDNHLICIDTKSSFGITGKEAENRLFNVNITVNKNAIPFDTEKPVVTSGVRIGTPVVTTRGMNEQDMEELADIIVCALKEQDIDTQLARTKALTDAYPFYED